MERKLSTVFALDVVGFSKLMAEDEARTLDNLKKRREFIDTIIEEYEGTAVVPPGCKVTMDKYFNVVIKINY